MPHRKPISRKIPVKFVGSEAIGAETSATHSFSKPYIFRPQKKIWNPNVEETIAYFPHKDKHIEVTTKGIFVTTVGKLSRELLSNNVLISNPKKLPGQELAYETFGKRVLKSIDQKVYSLADIAGKFAYGFKDIKYSETGHYAVLVFADSGFLMVGNSTLIRIS